MLPVRLSLRNFMSYGEAEEEVDFRDLRLACISGNNGEGKSALLDAITWALWGVARGTDLAGRGADDLIRLGAEEAQVIFEFQVDGDLWRVERRRRRGRSGDLALWRWTGDRWESAAGANPTLTGEFIKSLLGLNYETFVNSAFLLQGRADEFARQTATNRKEILADILGLGVFERLSRQARERAKRAQTKADFLEVEIARIEEELSREPEVKQEAGEAEKRLALARKQLQEARQELEGQQQRLAALEEKQRRAEELERGLQKIRLRLSELERAREKTSQRLDECQDLLRREKEIEDGFAALQKSRKEEQEWGEKARRFALLSRQREEYSLTIEREKAKLEAKACELKEKIETLIAKAKDEEVKSKAEACKEEIVHLEARQKEASEIRNLLQEAKEKRGGLTEQRRQLHALLTEKQETAALLESAEAVCPVCRGKLTEKRRRELLEELKKEQEEVARQLKECGEGISEAERLAEEKAHALKQIEEEGLRLAGLQQTLVRYKEMLAQAQTARKDLKLAREQLSGLEEELKKEEFAFEARKALAELDEKMLSLGYDEAAHRSSSQQAQALSSFEAEKAKLEHARSTAAAHREALQKVQAELEAGEQEIARSQQELLGLQAEVAELPAARALSAQLVEKSARAEASVSELEKRVAVVNNELARLKESRSMLAKRKKEKEQAEEEAVVHNDLAAAFGKNGVQALIIETALPQLEEHANELLARLSEGGMQVSFSTQKERSGAMAETLEIRIRDQSGERRYEMYSGGEAFRLNFAIRLALSRLLTQRAGAKLATLVIDEGFGSQDSAGRQRLVEAIRAVAADFDRILVITHLDELKAEFPHRIEVSKDEEGSHIRQLQSASP